MKTEYRNIAGFPALVIGEASERAWLFVHGKLGCKEEALAFGELACPMGWQVVGVDLPEHGARKGSPEKLLPWTAVPELQAVYRAMRQRWRQVSMRATSIGAWLSMLALQGQKPDRALFVSPVVDMEKLIETMMTWAGVTEEELKQKGDIPTQFGETLSWEYLCWVREHPVRWNTPTEILYAGGDTLTSRVVIDNFAAESGSVLTVMENGEHWFHTEEQLQVLREWERRCLTHEEAFPVENSLSKSDRM